MPNSSLRAVLQANQAGRALGLTSICSANPVVLGAAAEHAAQTGTSLLVESTCNQVNQDGGYTGMTPAAFRHWMEAIASQAGLPPSQLTLGGDHLGPSPWQAEPADKAMARARILVADYARAGYTKVHLDTSMRLGDDPLGPLAPEVVAGRAADLAAVAEAAAPHGKLLYVIGTEVPLPGGAQAHEERPVPTRSEDAAESIALTRAAFARRGLAHAWERVIALVVQPGVEFGDEQVFVYDREAARPLSRFIETQPGLVYEAHSTDYQPGGALRELVEDHFAILKVGPALTFAYREAIVALAAIENEWLARKGVELSGVRQALEGAMLANPAHWRKYYGGDESEQRFKRWFSYSDRIRYYWPQEGVVEALGRLNHNLSGGVPPALLSQYLPRQNERVREGLLPNEPDALAKDAVAAVLAQYAAACGASATDGEERN